MKKKKYNFKKRCVININHIFHTIFTVLFVFQIYKEYESFRREELQRYLEHLNKMKRLQKVEQVKKDLREKEQLLFFFDNEHKHDLVNEEKLKRMKKKLAVVKSPKEDLAYIPPEIRKSGFKRD